MFLLTTVTPDRGLYGVFNAPSMLSETVSRDDGGGGGGGVCLPRNRSWEAIDEVWGVKNHRDTYDVCGTDLQMGCVGGGLHFYP